jgi:DNA-binding MarR family transcriptional regulator
MHPFVRICAGKARVQLPAFKYHALRKRGFLGALSRIEAKNGMSMGDLARYLMVSRQNLAGLISRMERDGHIGTQADEKDRRSQLVKITPSGHVVWNEQALPKIHGYYEQALDGFSTNDLTHTLHYLLKLLDNMKGLDSDAESEAPETLESSGKK